MEALGSAGRIAGDFMTADGVREIEALEGAGQRGRPGSLRWASGASPRDRLFAAGSSFNFYQAVRVLAILAPGEARDSAHDAVPVRFRSRMGFDFPGSDIEHIAPASGNQQLPEMLVNFIGLAGAHGPLPAVYTEQLLRQGDSALRDFLDIFNRRLILLVYRVHEMHHPELTPTSPEQGLAANHLYAFFGLGRDPDSSGRNRLALPDRALLDYSGLLAHRPHSASGLERLLSDYFQVEVVVDQFAGAWHQLSEDQWTRLGVSQGRNQRLGDGAILGKRVWDQHAGVTIGLGPVDLETFKSFLPNGAAYRPLCDLARFYLGEEFDFSFKLLLEADQTPWAAIAGAEGARADVSALELGRLAWLKDTPRQAGIRVEEADKPEPRNQSAEGES
jgi:type VI secretion system protein ImpH